MRFERTWSLPTSPDDLRRRAVDADHRRAAHLADGSHDVRVSCHRAGSTDVVRLQRQVPTGAQGPAARVVGRFLAMVQTERWNLPDRTGAVAAHLRIAFPRRPISVVGRIVVEPARDGCTHHVSGVVTARVPGVGRLLEQRIVSSMLTALDRQLTS